MIFLEKKGRERGRKKRMEKKRKERRPHAIRTHPKVLVTPRLLAKARNAWWGP